MKEVASKAKVSIATVSRILNGDVTLNVREETREAVLSAAKELGYELKIKRTNTELTFGIVQWISSYQEKEDNYYHNIRMSVENYCVLNNIQIKRFYKENLNNVFKDKDIDGLLCIGKFSNDLADKMSINVPNIVFIDSNPDKNKYNSVYSDLKAGTRIALDHLVSKHHKVIGYIGGREYIETPRGKMFIDPREKEFLLYTEENEIVNNGAYYVGDFSAEHGYDSMKVIIESDNPPTAVFCGNDVIAIGALSALGESANSDKISIIGFNNTAMAQFYNPALTTINVDTKYMGELACELLEKLINERPKTPIQIICNVSLVERESVFELE